MIYFLLFSFGLIVGILVMSFMYKKQTTYGEINIDHYSELISIFADKDELKKLYKKRAIFTIDHNAVIDYNAVVSRDEHIL
jgi:hypothetical protein